MLIYKLVVTFFVLSEYIFVCYLMQSDPEAFEYFVSQCLNLVSGWRKSVLKSVVWKMKEGQSNFLPSLELSEKI